MAFADEPLTALFWPFLFIFIMVESLWMLIQDGIRKLRTNTTDKESKK